MNKLMTLEEFFEKLEKEGPYEDMIVRLSYKYDHEKETERIVSNELLIIGENGGFEWLNDWDEGYTSEKNSPVFVTAYITVSDVDVFGHVGIFGGKYDD